MNFQIRQAKKFNSGDTNHNIKDVVLAIPHLFRETRALRNFKKTKNRPATEPHPIILNRKKRKSSHKRWRVKRVFKHLERSHQLILWLVIQSPFKKGAKIALAGQLWVQTLFAFKASRKLEAQAMKYFCS